MDLPRLTLVKSDVSSCRENEQSEWLIDACDLEGMDVEEIDENTDVTGEQSLEKSWIAENKLNTRLNKQAHLEKAFEFTGCPECKLEDLSRPVLEICGHAKCRKCFIHSEDACQQCIGNLILEPSTAKEKEADKSNLERNNEVILPDRNSDSSDVDEEEDEEEERVAVHPNEYVFELGEKSGSKSIAVVSSETLKELGIAQDDDSEENEVANDSHENSVSDDDDDTFEENAKKVSKQKTRNKMKRPVNTDHIVLVDSESDDANPTKYKCLKCDKVFSQKYQHKYHVYCNPENGRRPYVCHCSEEFISQSHFLYHVRSKHTGEKPYECPVCSQRFIQKVKLNRHMTSHTTKPKSATERSVYLCAYCKKRFNTLSSCRRHIGNHTEEKPFECDKCDKTFKQKYSLDTHMRTHLNNRPFKCPDCDKAFSTAKDMRRHHLCHTGELPFECAFGDCKSRFRRKDNLERHIRLTHKLSEKIAKVLGQEAAKKYFGEDKTQDKTVVRVSRKKAGNMNFVEEVFKETDT